MRIQIDECRTKKCRRAGGEGFSSFFVLHSAFTLLEVMIAMALFFMATFSILAIVSNGLRNAAALRQDIPDASVIAAMLVTTNRLEDGSNAEGKFEDIAPGLYPGYRWAWEAREYATNGLFKIDFVIARDGRGWGPAETHMSILYYPPQPPQQKGVLGR